MIDDISSKGIQDPILFHNASGVQDKFELPLQIGSLGMKV